MRNAELTAEERGVVRRAPLFSGLSDEGFAALLADGTVLVRDRGEALFRQGERAKAFYVVLDGWVKIYRMTPGGYEAVVGVFGRGESFGEAVCFSESEYPVGGETVTPARLLMISALHLVERIRRMPEIGLAMLASTSQHLQLLVRQIQELKAHTGAQRVAEFLISLAAVERGPCIIALPYEKSLIAGRLGMTPESLSRAFQRLRSVGVRVDRHLARVTDMALLSQFVSRERTAALKCVASGRAAACLARTAPRSLG